MAWFFNSNILIFLLFLSPNCNGIELTWSQWQELQSLNLQSKSLKFSLEGLDKSATSLNFAQNILSASLLIQSFSKNEHITAKQIHQLNKWSRSDAQIIVHSLNNSQKSEVKVDIGKEAKAALNSIRSNTVAKELYQKWYNNEFSKDDLIALRGMSNKSTFIGFFNRLPPFLQTGFADWTMEKIQGSEMTTSGDYNYLIGHMAKILRSKQYAGFLIEKMPINQSSFLFLQSMPGIFEETELLELLTIATRRPKMRTHCFNLLAQYFSENTEVAELMASFLKDDQAYWRALTVMPAFVKAGNTQAFENVIKNLPISKQKQMKMRLQRKN